MSDIWIGSVKANGVTTGGSVGIGFTLSTGRCVAVKHNHANGTIHGDLANMPMGTGVVFDPDLLDATFLSWHQGPSTTGQQGG